MTLDLDNYIYTVDVIDAFIDTPFDFKGRMYYREALSRFCEKGRPRRLMLLQDVPNVRYPQQLRHYDNSDDEAQEDEDQALLSEEAFEEMFNAYLNSPSESSNHQPSNEDYESEDDWD